MDDTKREELEKACKNYKARTRMVAVRMVRVLDMSVDETANLQVHCPMWVRDWLRRYDEGGLEGLRDLQMRTAQKNFVNRRVRHHQFACDGPYPPAVLAPAAGSQSVPSLAGRRLFHHAANILPACVRERSVSLWNLCSVANRCAGKCHSGAELVPGSKSFDST